MGVCSLAGVWQAQHELTDGKFAAMQFHAEPAVGVLQAGAAADITLTFAPDSLHRQEARHTSPLICSQKRKEKKEKKRLRLSASI